MKYIKNNIVKSKLDIVIFKEGMQIINPTHDMIIEDGWEEFKPQQIIKEPTLESVINNAISDIEMYDSSESVNVCFIEIGDNKIPYWANKNERSVLKTAVQDCIAQGRTSYRLDLRELNVSIDMDCETLLNILSALEVYAIDCYNKTTDHIFAVKALTNIEDVKNYDYTIGYPDKLTFNI